MTPSTNADRRRRLAGAGLYLVAVLILLLLPLDLQPPGTWIEALRTPHLVASTWSGVEPLRMLGHLLLFVPAGIFVRHTRHAHHGFRVPGLILLTTIIAVAGELLQVLVGRDLSVLDASLNATGVACGIVLGPRIGQLVSWIGPRWFGALAVGCWVAMAASLAPWGASWATWDPGFSLILANEGTGDRPWEGELAELSVFDRVFTRREIAALLTTLPIEAEAISGHDPVLFCGFGRDAIDERADDTVRIEATTPGSAEAGVEFIGLGAFVTPEAEGISIVGTAHLQTPAAPATLSRRLREAGAMTLIVRFRATDPSIRGPGRIVTLSADPRRRNFTLGQEGPDLHWRLRNAQSGENGVLPDLVVRDGVRVGQRQTVVVVADARASRVHIDGVRSTVVLYTPLQRASAILFDSKVSTPMAAALLVLSMLGFSGLAFVALRGMGVHVAREIAAAAIGAMFAAALLATHVGWTWIVL